MNLQSGRCTDAAGNGNQASNTITVAADLAAPAVVLTAPAQAKAAFAVTVAFTESVTGLVAGDFTITNGTGTLAGTGASYTLTVTGSSQGNVTVVLPANACADAAGNGKHGKQHCHHCLGHGCTDGHALRTSGPVDSPFDVTFTASETISGLTSRTSRHEWDGGFDPYDRRIASDFGSEPVDQNQSDRGRLRIGSACFRFSRRRSG